MREVRESGRKREEEKWESGIVGSWISIKRVEGCAFLFWRKIMANDDKFTESSTQGTLLYVVVI